MTNPRTTIAPWGSNNNKANERTTICEIYILMIECKCDVSRLEKRFEEMIFWLQHAALRADLT